MTDIGHGHDDRHLCPTCQQPVERARIDVIDVAAAVAADKLSDADIFKRTYLGHGTQSSVFVFQGHPGPFRTHVHVTHDEIGYVLEGTGSVTVEDAPQVLFISSPIDDPDNQDRVWLD